MEPEVSADECALWADIENFAIRTEYPQVIRACRRWALEAAGSESVVMALAYAHAVRQLKYPDTDKGVAISVARAAGARLLDLA